MAERSEGAELTLTSEEEECEMSMCDTDGEPWGHVTEPPAHVSLARLRASPQPLSMETLQGARDALERCGELDEELGSCLDLALERFSREPRCVQENARLGIRWGAGSLEFLSGEGQYRFSVSCQEGNPRYSLQVEDLPGHLYVARLRSRKDPLSADSLLRFHTELGLCRGDTAALRNCLYTAWEGLIREPWCVQENARLGLQWRKKKLEFVSGRGQCKISVHHSDGEPQYRITELGGDRSVTWSHATPELLSVADLARVRDRLGRWGALGRELSRCFGEAISQFSREPRCVQENARMRIQGGREELLFISGWGQCEISVRLADGEPQYRITELGGDRSMTWSHSSPEPLSITDLARVRDRLGRWGALGGELSRCFGEAISQFSREPVFVQGNARMRIYWDGRSLEFLSGEGQSEISVRYRDGRAQYDIRELPLHLYLDQVCTHPDPLSADTLWRVWDKLGSCSGDTDAIRACFHRAWEGFSQEPPSVQENAWLLIQCGERQVTFASGMGTCKITVRYEDGKPQYDIKKTPVHVYWVELRARRALLSADTLRRVMRDLECYSGVTDPLRACFHCAWEGFSREPRCVQENARLRIQWHGKQLMFISGQRQCEISVLNADGKPQYHITELGGARPMIWAHATPEPLSVADLVRVRDRLGRWGPLDEEQSGCLGEAISQFSREPRCVQENARMKIYSDKGSLEFLSGDGECEISVRCRDGRPQYDMGELPLHMYLARLRTCPDPLSTDTLWRVWDKLRSYQRDRDDLRTCFHHAWEEFSREPLSVQENARLRVCWGGQILEFLSGDGECEIFVRCRDGRPQYDIGELPLHLYLARLRACPEPLSADTLWRVRDKLGSCKGDTDDLRACFHRAWERFSREPLSVQENARLLIQWGGEKLEFVSGQGENLITECKGEEGRIQNTE